jgi:uncharacterized membrane protein YdjX (TVP38/TMEM64 family)
MFEVFFGAHPILGPVSFIIIRALIVLVPFFPGVLADIPALAFFGWVPAFFYTEISILIGSSVSFALARYGKHILLRAMPVLSNVTHHGSWTERERFVAILVARLSTLPLFDYVAGFSRISYPTFLGASIIGSIPPTFLFYYFGGKIFSFGMWYGVAFLLILAALVIPPTLRKWRSLQTLPKNPHPFKNVSK